MNSNAPQAGSCSSTPTIRTPRPVPQLVKHLLRRIDPDEREMGILMGMFGKIHRALAGQVPVKPVPLQENETGED